MGPQRALGGVGRGLRGSGRRSRSALYWNPAGLQQVDQAELQLSHSRLFADQSLSVAGVGWPVWRAGHRETWAVGVTYLAMDPFDVVSENTTVGTAQISDGVATLSYARPMGPIHFGLSTKLIRQDLDVVSGQTYAVDMGLLGQSSSERWSWGLTAANMGPAMTIGNQEIGLPFVFRAGMSALLARSRRAQWLVSLQADAPIDDSVQGHAGVEYRTALGNNWNAALRGGLQSQEAQGRWAVGASLERGPLALHYTFSENADLGVVNRLEVGAHVRRAPGPGNGTSARSWPKPGQRSALLAGESMVRPGRVGPVEGPHPLLPARGKVAGTNSAPPMWETLDPLHACWQPGPVGPWEAGDPETAAPLSSENCWWFNPTIPSAGPPWKKPKKKSPPDGWPKPAGKWPAIGKDA
jgi:hypothetical protein